MTRQLCVHLHLSMAGWWWCVYVGGGWLMAVCCVLPMETVVFSCKYPAMAIGEGVTVSPFLSWEPW